MTRLFVKGRTVGQPQDDCAGIGIEVVEVVVAEEERLDDGGGDDRLARARQSRERERGEFALFVVVALGLSEASQDLDDGLALVVVELVEHQS